MLRAERFAKPFRVRNGRTFRLKDVDPEDTGPIKSRKQAEHWLERGVARLAQLQEKLYAQDSWALLLIFQAMDAAGKDSTIKHVMSGVNPQGCQVYSFKAPSAEELDHDFLWRTSRCLPERGRIGIFNRSYYEETLVVRVHPRCARQPEVARLARNQADLGRTLRGHRRIRAVCHSQRHRHSKILSSRVAKRAEAAFSGASRPEEQELEIFGGRREGKRSLARLHARV